MLSARFSEFGRPQDVIELIDAPDPGAPGAGEVTIDTELVPINPADLLNLEGRYGASPPALPMMPGAEGVGRIAAVGAGVTHVKPGERVLLPGPGTWRARSKTSAKAVFALPDGVDPRQLAMLRVNPPTADRMLHDFVAPKPGNWVIQNAANSGVGHCLIRLARRAGLKSVNVVRREGLARALEAHGADAVVLDGAGLDARVRAIVGKRGGALPLAIDAVGGEGTQRLARCVDDGGIVVNYGLLSGAPCMIDGRETVFRDVTLRGFWLRAWYTKTAPAEIADTYRALAALVADGTLAVEVEKVYPVKEIAAALEHAGRGGRGGKILVDFAGG